MFVTVLLSKIRSYMKYRESIRELSALTDAQLSDIGIARGQIEHTARTIAFQ